MAVRTASFEIAAFESETKKDEHRYVELAHGGGRFSLWRPVTQGQFGLFVRDMNRSGGGIGSIPVVDRLLERVLLTAEQVQEAATAGELDAEGVKYSDRIEAGATPVGADFLWEAYAAGAFKDEEGDDTLTPIYQMIGAVMKEATGFPTGPSSASTSTPKRSGPSSTATSRRQGSPRSTSRRAASQP